MENIGITEVTVMAARTFGDPQQDWMFHQPQVSLTAGIGPGGEYALVVKRLQAVAENLLEEHCTQFPKALEQGRSQQQAKQSQSQKESKLPAGTVPFRQSPHDVYPPPSPPAA